LDILWVAVLVFGVSFLSNVSPFFGASYTLLATLQLTLLGFTPYNFFVVVVVSAVGATVAKLVIYAGAFGFSDLLLRNKNVQLIRRNSRKSSFYLVLFVTALLPVLPLDDFIYIGAGASAASLSLMSMVTLLAKLLKSAFEVAVEFTILKDIGEAFGFHRLDATLALSALFVLVGIGIYKLDWEKIYKRFRPEKEGPPEASPPPSKPL
jgi:hypothetical protein